MVGFWVRPFENESSRGTLTEIVRVLQKRDHEPVVLREDDPCVRVPSLEHLDASPEKGVVALRQHTIQALEAAVAVVVRCVQARQQGQGDGHAAGGNDIRHDDVPSAVMDQPVHGDYVNKM
jgi:hypothetical protein